MSDHGWQDVGFTEGEGGQVLIMRCQHCAEFLFTVELETGEGAQDLTCGFECRGQEALAAANAI